MTWAISLGLQVLMYRSYVLLASNSHAILPPEIRTNTQLQRDSYTIRWRKCAVLCLCNWHIKYNCMADASSWMRSRTKFRDAAPRPMDLIHTMHTLFSNLNHSYTHDPGVSWSAHRQRLTCFCSRYVFYSHCFFKQTIHVTGWTATEMANDAWNVSLGRLVLLEGPLS